MSYCIQKAINHPPHNDTARISRIRYCSHPTHYPMSIVRLFLRSVFVFAATVCALCFLLNGPLGVSSASTVSTSNGAARRLLEDVLVEGSAGSAVREDQISQIKVAVPERLKREEAEAPRPAPTSPPTEAVPAKVHEIVVSVCCLSNYHDIKSHPQEFIQLLYSTSIEPLGKAIRQTPLKPLESAGAAENGTASLGADAVRFDLLDGSFATNDIELRFEGEHGSAASPSPLNLVFSIKGHADSFLDNLVHQIWLRAHLLEVAMVTTIDSHLGRSASGLVSVKWISPHFDSPRVDVSMLQRMAAKRSGAASESAEEDHSAADAALMAQLQRNKLRESNLAADLRALQKLEKDTLAMRTPLHAMEGFMEHRKSRLRSKLSVLQQALRSLEQDQKYLLKQLQTTKESMALATANLDQNWEATSSLLAKEEKVWLDREQFLVQMRQFEKEWNRVVQTTTLYEAFLLQKYRANRMQHNTSPKKYFVKNDDDRWKCSHSADDMMCNEQAISCRATSRDVLGGDDVVVEVSSHFVKPGTMRSDYEMLLFSDNECASWHLFEPMKVEAATVHHCEWQGEGGEAGDGRCTFKQQVASKEMDTLCLFIRCNMSEPFAMYSQMEARSVSAPKKELAPKIKKAREEGQTAPNLLLEKHSNTENESKTAARGTKQWVTAALTVAATAGALVMSCFFMPRK